MKKNPVLLVFSHVLFDWLVTGHVVEVNPAHAVRGPKHVVRKGKTPVLTAEEVRALLDSIPTVKVVKKGGVERTVPDLLGLRDRAIIGTMTYSFARVGAVVGMMGISKPLESRTTPMDTCFDLRPAGQGPCQGSHYRNPTFTGWCAGVQRRPESQRESATTRFARPGSPRI